MPQLVEQLLPTTSEVSYSSPDVSNNLTLLFVSYIIILMEKGDRNGYIKSDSLPLFDKINGRGKRLHQISHVPIQVK